MARGISRLFLAFSFSFVVGCGSGAANPGVDPNDPRLQVTGRLREACADYGVADAFIEQGLLALESDRLDGTPYVDARLAVDCSGDQACTTCLSEMVDQVHGQ